MLSIIKFIGNCLINGNSYSLGCRFSVVTTVDYFCRLFDKLLRFYFDSGSIIFVTPYHHPDPIFRLPEPVEGDVTLVVMDPLDRHPLNKADDDPHWLFGTPVPASY